MPRSKRQQQQQQTCAASTSSTSISPDQLTLPEGLASGKVASIKGERRLAGLWAGYGQVSSVQLEVEEDAGSVSECSAVIKRVQPPAHGKGVGHARKVRSYQVEAAFYRTVATDLISKGLPIPNPYFIKEHDGQFTFVLSDLRRSHPLSRSSLTKQETESALEFLALLHASGWERAYTRAPQEYNKLWDEGGYWDLSTREEEWESMDVKEWGQLKSVSHAVARRMRGHKLIDGQVRDERVRFRTLVHGDCKAENLLFERPHEKGARGSCAAYDFQYCGEGYGAKDVAYLLASSVDARVLSQYEQELLMHYHTALLKHLGGQDCGYTWDTLLAHYDLCMLDYVRFMAGWGFWGNASHAVKRAQSIVQRVVDAANGRHGDWDEALWTTWSD